MESLQGQSSRQARADRIRFCISHRRHYPQQTIGIRFLRVVYLVEHDFLAPDGSLFMKGAAPLRALSLQKPQQLGKSLENVGQ